MAVDIYCKIDGVDGESTDEKYPKWIEISSFDHSVNQAVSQASSTGGRTGGKADFSPFTVVKTIDSATCDLNIHCANGKHIPLVEIECCLATEDKHTFMKYTMEDVIVSAVTAGGSVDAGETRPTEQVAFVYGKLKWEYTPIDQTGSPGASIDRSWNLELNKQE